MVLFKEIIQNWLLGFDAIASIARRYHSTGMHSDSDQIKRVYEMYLRFESVSGKDILEIGPGQTLATMEMALASGAESCTALDVADYIAADHPSRKRVRYTLYDGKMFPFESEQFDLIWSHTAFEHLRYPVVTVAECFRVLRPKGKLVTLIDLGDHTAYGGDKVQPLKLFECLQYSEREWNLMKWNRSSYTNRLRKSDWKRLFDEAGFVLRGEECSKSEDIARTLPTLPYLHKYSYDDAVTSVLTVSLEKPSAR